MAITRKTLQESVLNRICHEMLYLASTNITGKVPYGVMRRLLRENQKDNPWLSRDNLNFHYRKYKRRPENVAVAVPNSADIIAENVVVETPVADIADEHSSVIEDGTTISVEAESVAAISKGRPKGSTKASAFLVKDALTAAKNEITQIYWEGKARAVEEHRRLEDGWLQKLVDSVKQKRGIESNVPIPLKTIRNRMSAFVLHPGKQSLMAPVEPKLVDLVLAMAKIRRCLTVSECLVLANDLIKGTPLETKIIEWKKSINILLEPGEAVLGRKYWALFKKRWEHKLVSKRGQKFAMDRNNALTYSNMRQMYEDVYESLVEAGVATKLPAPMLTEPGNLKCNYQVTHPEMCLVVDEVGGNLNQKDDGHVGGQKFMCEVGAIPQLKASIKDRHFTLLGFTALSGEPVMCLLILAGVEEKMEVEMGIDLIVPTFGSVDDDDYFEKNSGKGKIFPMGPECDFRGTKVPCMVRWSKKGSITSEILRDALKTLNHFSVLSKSLR